MIAVWKYPLQYADEQEIALPRGAEVLSFRVQGRQGLCLWAKVNVEEKRLEERLFVINGTGNPLDTSRGELVFIGTVCDGPLVWHLFERKSIPL